MTGEWRQDTYEPNQIVAPDGVHNYWFKASVLAKMNREHKLAVLAMEAAEKVNYREHAFDQPELPLGEYLKWLHDWCARVFEVSDPPNAKEHTSGQEV